MPRKDWIKNLPDGFTIYARRTTTRGEMTDFAVVLIYGGECIARFDTAHGFAHKDVLGRKSALIRKEKYDNLSVKEAFEHAINDLSENYEAYLQFFLEH